MSGFSRVLGMGYGFGRGFYVELYPVADGILALLVALYIFYEFYYLSGEVIDSLVDRANPEIEMKLKKIFGSIINWNFLTRPRKSRRISFEHGVT